MTGTTRKFLQTLAFCVVFGGYAHAQEEELIPDMPVPPITIPGVGSATGAVPNTLDSTDRMLRRLTRTRALRIEQLAREHRPLLERDADGELVVRAEVLAIDISADALRRALDAKFLLKRTQELAELGVKISVLQAPEGWSARRGLKELRGLDPAGTYDYNHVYLDGGGAAGALPLDQAETAGGAGATGRVGLIDGGVDSAHRVFEYTRFQRFGCEGRIVPSIHGTAVAAILATQESIGEIFAADVYCGQPTGGASDAVTAALGWLARERVAVINISLVGPRNALLERAVNTLVGRGFLIVAAVGNDGPAAPPLYPASFPGVVGVTAVDGEHRVLVEAARGEQVDFAARGADMRAASQAPEAFAPVRGTSFATPIVTSQMVMDLQAPDATARDGVIAKWSGRAKDLGKRGRDDVYGAGELGDVPAQVAEESAKAN